MLLTISETAKLMGVCENTLRDWDENGKFVATRTEGGHRRYSLDQVRDYVEKNQKIEPPQESIVLDNELVNRWKDWLADVNYCDKHALAVLLDNACESNKINKTYNSPDDLLWITKYGFLKSRFKRMVDIQPIFGPTGPVFYFADNCLKSGSVAIKSKVLNFKVFSNSKLNLKEVYAETLAMEIDEIILDMLPKTSDCNLQSSLKLNPDIIQRYDYVIAPNYIIEKVKKVNKDIEAFEIPEMLADENPLDVVTVVGKYSARFSLPIFCPFVLFKVAPKTFTNVQTCMISFATYNGEEK